MSRQEHHAELKFHYLGNTCISRESCLATPLIDATAMFNMLFHVLRRSSEIQNKQWDHDYSSYLHSLRKA